MNRTVVDTSALLAVVNGESGATEMMELLSQPNGRALISAVNLSEAQAVLVHRGVPEEDAWQLLFEFDLKIVAFDAEQARSAGALIVETGKLGLSFGDRACLALGIQEKCLVVTADKAWKKLKVDVSIQLIRPLGEPP